ncbi:LPXTG cell wall anchor domain-containing protein [Bacillus sp. RO3]|nr:LPXTG cell wall anchor domain-containing protein [Bacillus sp. RO3]
MKKYLIFVGILLMLISLPNFVFSAGNRDLGLDISANNLLFNTGNMKPGDSISKNLTIQNNGKEDFEYMIEVLNEVKEKDILFKELEITVLRGEKPIYSGKLKDIGSLEPVLLKIQTQDHLFFTIEMPYELGNEYQGVVTEFMIRVVAQVSGDETSTPTSPQVDSENNENPTVPVFSQGPSLPNTGTNIYSILLLGAILITTGLTFIFINKRISSKKES